jgi:hypothetical protein
MSCQFFRRIHALTIRQVGGKAEFSSTPDWKESDGQQLKNLNSSHFF